MDEAIKIYKPEKQLFIDSIIGDTFYADADSIKEEIVSFDKQLLEKKDNKKNDLGEWQEDPKKKVPHKKETYYETFQRVLEERDAEEDRLNEKYPWFNYIYRRVIVGLTILLAVSFVWWGIKVHNMNKESAIRATAYAEFEAEQKAKEEAEASALKEAKMSLENQQKENAFYKAQVLYGARNFEDKYGYTKADFLTLCQCIDNRCAYYGMTVKEVVQQENQWVGYYSSNPGDVDKYYKIALESEKTKATQETKPVSSDYVYAYYTDRGIYLSNKYGENNGFGMWRHE